ncbi:MAG: biotin transporter BioY [Alphaproteobacteria bacterium]
MSIQAAPAALQPTLVSALWPQQQGMRDVLRLVVLALAGTALLVLSAKIKVPFWPVPMTMQTFAVLVIGMAYGWRLGAATVVLYLLEGAVGLPVFTGTPERGIGVMYMYGPTGGFLLGFVVGAAISGWLAEQGWDRSVVRTLGAMLAGEVAMFVLGLAWLAHLFGASKAIEFGLAPFVWAEIFKIALAAAVMPGAWWLLRRLR